MILKYLTIKKVIPFISILFLLNSCICFRKTPNPVVIYQKDSIFTTQIYKDTTVHLKLPADTIYSVDTIIIKENNQLYIAPVVLRKGIITAKASIIDNKLKLTAYINDSCINYNIPNAIRITNTVKSESIQIESSNKYSIPIWLYLLIFSSLLIIVTVVLYIMFRKTL
jgi:hypothetical protein